MKKSKYGNGRPFSATVFLPLNYSSGDCPTVHTLHTRKFRLSRTEEVAPEEAGKKNRGELTS